MSEPDASSPKRAGGRLGCTCFGCLLVLALPLYLVFGPPIILPTSFNPVAWRADNAMDGRGRQRMLDDVLENHVRIGMTGAEVLDLLGPADNRSGGGYVLHYNTGGKRGPGGYLALESEFLYLFLSDQDQLTEVQVYTVD